MCIFITNFCLNCALFVNKFLYDVIHVQCGIELFCILFPHFVGKLFYHFFLFRLPFETNCFQMKNNFQLNLKQIEMLL